MIKKARCYPWIAAASSWIWNRAAPNPSSSFSFLLFFGVGIWAPIAPDFLLEHVPNVFIFCTCVSGGTSSSLLRQNVVKQNKINKIKIWNFVVIRAQHGGLASMLCVLLWKYCSAVFSPFKKINWIINI